MLKVIVNSTVSEENIEAFLKIYQELIDKTRKEVGCIKYELFQQIDEVTHFTLIEEWETRAHLTAHTKTEHFTTLVPLLAKLEKEEPALLYHQVL